MSDLRPTTGHQRRQLKAVIRRTVEMAGGVTSFEHVTRVKPPALSKYISPDDDVHMPVDVVFDLVKDTSCIAILSFILADLGYQAVPIEVAPRDGDLPGMRDFNQLTKGISDLFSVVTHSVDDGVITPNEARDILAKIYKMFQQLFDLQRKVQAAVDGGAS